MLSALLKFGAVALAFLQGTSALSGTCNTTYVRKPWDYLTENEKTSYLEAELCLFNSPSKLDNVVAAETRWDDLQYLHLTNAGGSDWVHFVGAFTNWHRYLLAVHERLLREECGYTGATPYWNETYDSTIGIQNSSIFSKKYFGTNGYGSTVNCSESSGSNACLDSNKEGGCVIDGYFANQTLHVTNDTEEAGDYCISRNFYTNNFNSSQPSNIQTCLNYTDFAEMWNCIESRPHAAGHSGTGGLMTDVKLSPGDPIFYLHHAFIDAVYWWWQNENLTERLTIVNGTNNADGCSGDCQYWVPYDGDPGNTTTLNHTLYMAGVAENLTIADVIDLRGWPSCAEYYYPDFAFGF